MVSIKGVRNGMNFNYSASNNKLQTTAS